MIVLPLTTALTDLKSLTTPTVPYKFEDHTPEETEQLAKDMIESMYHYEGLGISANQLGLPWRVFAIRGPDSDFICFNPFVAYVSEEKVSFDEACLSFPGMVFDIERPQHIRIRFADHHREVDTFKWSNLTARIVLHELDHLNGKIYFEGVSRITLEQKIRKAKRRGFDYTGKLMKYAKKATPNSKP